MLTSLKQIVHTGLHRIGLDLIQARTMKRLLESESAATTANRQLELLRMFDDQSAGRLLKLLPRSRAQLQQDLFALACSGFAQGGYFVEFGAASGVDLSNTYLLEKDFNWNGILAEPALGWRQSLSANRSCALEFDCVWSQTGQQLEFREVSGIPELSTISSFVDADFQAPARSAGRSYEVRTISLLDLLKRHQAPTKIDYLSIDTEGSEFDILSAFDFDAYDVRVITCEHNFSSRRADILSLLASHGYERTMENVSLFDDWYVRRT